LDGYPRTIAQAEFLGELVEITVALNIDVDDDLVIKRMTARRTCSQCGVNFNVLSKPTRQEGICDECGGKLYTRADAKPEAIAERLRIYHQQIDPILDYYRRAGTLVEVDGRPTITEVWEEVKQKIII
jgi:adenylate kinase